MKLIKQIFCFLWKIIKIVFCVFFICYLMMWDIAEGIPVLGIFPFFYFGFKAGKDVFGYFKTKKFRRKNSIITFIAVLYVFVFIHVHGSNFREDGGLIVIAMEEYKEKEGRYPQDLISLTPTYLDVIPKLVCYPVPLATNRGDFSYTLDKENNEYQLSGACGYIKYEYFSKDKRWSSQNNH